MYKNLNSHSTIKELMQTITANGGIIKTDIDSICLFQDIIGHSTIGDLEEIANDITGKEQFYRLYGIAYGTVDAIKFYVNHSNRICELMSEKEFLQSQNFNLNKEIEALNGKLDKAIEGHVIKSNEWQLKESDLNFKIEDLEQEITAKDQEIIILKAKLFDLITK